MQKTKLVWFLRNEERVLPSTVCAAKMVISGSGFSFLFKSFGAFIDFKTQLLLSPIQSCDQLYFSSAAV